MSESAAASEGKKTEPHPGWMLVGGAPVFYATTWCVDVLWEHSGPAWTSTKTHAVALAPVAVLAVLIFGWLLNRMWDSERRPFGHVPADAAPWEHAVFGACTILLTMCSLIFLGGPAGPSRAMNGGRDDGLGPHDVRTLIWERPSALDFVSVESVWRQSSAAAGIALVVQDP